MQSGEMPLLFKLQFSQLWTRLYEKYYGQKAGWMAGFVLLAFNLQLGAGRNSFTFTLCNFNVLASWNARYGKAAKAAKVVEMPQQGPQVQMLCFLCQKTATVVTPICESCAAEVMEKKGASGTN